MARQRNRFLRNAFHQIAVGGQHIGIMIDQILTETGIEHPLGQSHADRGGNALSQWTGGHFDARRVAMLGMAGGFGAHLAEVFEFIKGQALDACQIEQRIKQHRAMSGRQDETVTIQPLRSSGIKGQKTGKQHGRHIGSAHRQARMSGFGFFHAIHGKRTDGIGHQLAV